MSLEGSTLPAFLLICSGPAALAFSLYIFHKSARSYNRNVVRRALAVSTFVLFSVSYSYVLLSSPEARAGMIEELSWLVAAVFGFYFGYRVIDRWNLVRIAELYGKEGISNAVLDKILREFIDDKESSFVNSSRRCNGVTEEEHGK